MKFFTTPMYIKVYANRFVITVFGEREYQLEAIPEQPFTTARLLVGNFREAEKTLSQGIKKSLGGGLIKRSPIAVIHPVEKTEGGLCEVEVKIFNELALGSGAAKVIVHEGRELSKTEVLENLKNG